MKEMEMSESYSEEVFREKYGDPKEIHWACGKVDCDCDEQYEQWADAEYFRNIDDDEQASMANQWGE